MEKRTAVRVATSAMAVTALAVGCLAAAPGAEAKTPRKAVPNSKPTWLARASHLGAASTAAPVHLRVYLAPNGGLDAVKAAVRAVSTPSSPEYRQFLSSAEYQARFAPTSTAVGNVRTWLAGSGLTVTGVEAHNRYVTVSGSAAAAQKAFGVSLQRYQHDGQSVIAPSGAATVPSSIAGSVLSVSGLDSTVHKVAHTAKKDAPPPAGFVNARPCSLSYGQVQAKYQADFHTPLPKYQGNVLAYAPCGYTGPQFRAAYEGDTDLDGTGVTVAITDAYAAPTIAKDAKTYATNHGDAGYAKGQFTQSVPAKYTHQADCDPSGWYGEETLDVEAVHAMAGGANIKYYASASCYDADFLDTLAKVVDDNQAQLVSNSWSDVEANESVDTIAAYEQIFLQGALQGVSFLFSSGDNGDNLASTGLKQVDYPASDPYVTAVGGTSASIGTNGALKETGWGTQKYSLSADGKSWTPVGFLYGAGGGYSALFNQPDYQAGVVPGSAPAGRAVPDVGLDADPTTGMLVGETQTFPNGVRYGEYRIGGTSLASPLFAGMTALTLQNAGGGIGLLNPTIYSQAGSGTFTDVKPAGLKDLGNVRPDYANGVDASGGILYSVRTFNQDSTLKVTKGWDDVTGVGSPNNGWLTSVNPLS
ncbi:MAG TPA: S53 family peptidase [Jatrophihabitantaceae bacterium]|jgi:subtilase family serine protease